MENFRMYRVLGLIMKEYDYLIVGSGIYGATFAYLAKQNGKKCLVIDKRPHLGGNVYCDYIEGINVHKYGPHIFHTSNKEVWDFVNSFVEFNHFVNSPLANYKGQLYNLPFNMNTFYQLWRVRNPESAKQLIEIKRQEALKTLKGSTPKNLEEQAKTLVGDGLYNIFIKGYTQKQWGRDCKDLPPFIIKRLPIRYTFDNNYFKDKYQGIPIGGYNVLINKLLEGIDTEIETDFFTSKYFNWRKFAKKLVYTGPIDQYFNYIFGRLEWRTVEFKTSVLDTPNYQGNAVINYTDISEPYTRIIEHKHFEMFGDDVYKNSKTVISEEYSIEHSSETEPYYPINDERNSSLFEKYQSLAEKETDVIFGGRLAEYKYYDMAPIIESLLNKKDEI